MTNIQLHYYYKMHMDTYIAYMMQIVRTMMDLLNLLCYGYTYLNLSIVVLLYKIHYRGYKVIDILDKMWMNNIKCKELGIVGKWNLCLGRKLSCILKYSYVCLNQHIQLYKINTYYYSNIPNKAAYKAHKYF